MIKAAFFKKNGAFTGFSVSGHADFADFGKDVVCAAVSSAVMLSANTVTDFFKADAAVLEDNNTVKLTLSSSNAAAEAVIESLCFHLGLLAKQYKGTIEISVTKGVN